MSAVIEAGGAPRPAGPAAVDAAARRGEAVRPKRRSGPGRLARPLVLTLAMLTLLLAGGSAVLAVAGTGSVRPADWTRVDWMAAAGQTRSCVDAAGAGLLGCVLAGVRRPAPAAQAAVDPPRATPYYSTATIPDRPAAPATTPGRRASARPTTPTPAAVSASQPAIARLVTVPAGASRAQVLAACQAAARTAQGQGPAAVQEVQRECAALLADGGGERDD